MKTVLASILSVPTIASATHSLDLATEIAKSYDPAIEVAKLRSDSSFSGCPFEEFEVRGRDPITGVSRKVSVSFYQAKGADAGRAAVIILPPTGGVNLLDRGYANELCSAGVSAALVSGWEHQSETSLDFTMHDKGAMRALAATRHVVEFLKKQKTESIGVLGTSIGAIAGTLVVGLEPRITSVALIVGSARFADVIADSNEEGAVKLRETRMAKFGLESVEAYRKAVREAVRIEPSEFLGLNPLPRALVVSADADVTVASEYQYELARALKAEVHIRLRGNHLQAIKQTYWQHRDQVVEFFRKTLK